MKKLMSLLKAISDPTRFKLLKLLQHRTSCVCELTAAIGLAQPTVSRHLKQMEEAGLVVSERKAGQWIIYSLAVPSCKEVEGILQLVSTWQEDSREIVALRGKLDQIAQLKSLKKEFGVEEKEVGSRMVSDETPPAGQAGKPVSVSLTGAPERHHGV